MCVAVAVLFAKTQRLVPGFFGQLDQVLVGAIGVVEGNRVYVHLLVAVSLGIGGSTVIAHHPQHMFPVALVTRKWAKLRSHLSRGCIGHAGHDRRQRTAKGTPLRAVIRVTHVHQQAADVGKAKAKGAEIITQPRNFLGRELRHHHRDFQRQRPKAAGVHVAFRIEHTVGVERQQVQRREVTGGVVQEHVFRTRVRAADRAVFRAGVPCVDGVMVLDAGIGAGPRGVANLFPQIAGFDLFRNRPVSAVQKLPHLIVLNRLQEGVCHPDRVVGVLARDRVIGFAVPIRIIGRKLNAGVALLGVIQHTLHVSFGDRYFFGVADRLLQAGVLGGINRILNRAIPFADCGEDSVEHFLMHLRTGDDGGNFLLLQHLPVDEFLDIGVIGINNNHLGGAPCGAP